MKEQEYAFVVDIKGTKLSPTKAEKAWYKVRHSKAKILNLKPLTIQLNYEVVNTDASKFYMGLDVGQTTGIAIVQECKTYNKVVFKGEIRHRKDISKLVTQRAGYRRLRRTEKRYRPARFNNRGSSKTKGRLAPSIKCRQDEILRVVKHLQGFISLFKIVIEDVSFDIRALTDGYKPYSWQYQKSNRLDENIRKAVLLRDSHTCQMCKSNGCMLEVHHITPRRENGENTIGNLVTLCSKCHSKVTNYESNYKELFYSITKGKQIGLRYASHAMQGKFYLQSELSKLVAIVEKTDGGTTSNRRIDWGIEKSHSSDAVVITGLHVFDVSVYEHIIQPLRKKRQCNTDKTLSIVQGDKVYYFPRGKVKALCYVTAVLLTGKSNGMYKLTGVKDSKHYGPVAVKRLVKIPSSLRGLRVS